MSQLTPDIVQQILDACTAGAAEAAGSLSSALDNVMQIADVAGGEPLSAAELPEDLNGPGLAIGFTAGEQGLTLLLPEATNLLPPWYVQPDPTGESKLQTLAQELSMLLLPEDLATDKFTAGAVSNLAEAVRNAECADPAGCVSLTMSGDDGSGTFYLLWPLAAADKLVAPQANSSPEKSEQPVATVASPAAAASSSDVGTLTHLDELPSYSRSLLSIRVPVIVNLATTKMKVDDILHLGTGSIIHFDKSCEDSLDLEAGDHKLAEGEAVKVGDKFGLRITSIRLPGERYKKVGRDSA